MYEDEPVWKGHLFINHTIILDSELTKDNIIYALIRGGMITGFGVQPDWDVCMPVVLPDGRIGCIWIQVKNWLVSIAPSKYQLFFKDMLMNNVLLHAQEKRQTTALENLYIVINLRQGQPGVSTNFECENDGGIFMQGTLDKLFLTPSDEQNVFELLSELLRAQRASERQREKEMTPEARNLFKKQDHGRTSCTLEHWRGLYNTKLKRPLAKANKPTPAKRPSEQQ